MEQDVRHGQGPRKSTIFFARTYRRLNPDRKAQILYILLLVLTCVIAFLFLYPQLTESPDFTPRTCPSASVTMSVRGVSIMMYRFRQPRAASGHAPRAHVCRCPKIRALHGDAASPAMGTFCLKALIQKV